jgi:GDP-mannose transporter
MTVTNKYVLSKYKFNLNFLLLSVQSIVTVSLLHIFHFLNLSQFRAYNHDEAKKWFPIAAFLVAMIYTGSKALQFLRIPIYTIFKNLTIILIAYGEVIWFGGGVTRVMLVSFILMVLSSVIAGWSDIADTLAVASTSLTNAELEVASNTLWGYLWMSFNCISSAGFVLYMRKRIKLTNFKDFDTVYYNNLLSIPLLLVLTFVFEDWSVANLEANFPLEARSSLIWSMVFSGVSAFGISYTSAWCVRVTSSTTYSMVGALNKLPVAASGMIFFGDPVTFGSVTAIMVGFFAGLVYSHAKTEQSRLAKQGQVQSMPMSSSSQSMADGNKANSI